MPNLIPYPSYNLEHFKILCYNRALLGNKSIIMDYVEHLFKNNFLEYASYVIKDRAIPSLEDGLKPVQRPTTFATL